MTLFHKVELISTVEKNADYADSWLWEKFLVSVPQFDTGNGEKALNNVAVPVSAFREHVLREYIEHIEKANNMVLQVEVKDYKKIVDSRLKVFWICTVLKIAGYRALCRWVGSKGDEDNEHDFWVNLGSADVRGLGIDEESNEVCVPPRFLENRWRETNTYRENLLSSLKALSSYNSIAKSFIDAKNRVGKGGSKLQVGQRLELLDNGQSTRVRPARVKAICGRRIWVQVLKIDCDTHEEDDRQYGPTAEFWVDQSSFFLFPVGWATLNGYGLEAKKDYKKHTRLIADAILNKTEPPYASIDVRPEQLSEWKKVPHADAEWERGMKFELMDPLGATVRDLHVASVLEILQDGYLKVGMDGPDAEDECIPVHCTSHLLFPVGYAKKHGLELHGPGDSEQFDWPSYLKQCKAKAAPENFFKPDPDQARMDEFQIGAKLEASDMCENLLICPGTVVAHRGRLLHIHFDGWADEFDQYFDVDSKDIFPLGWCEIHGYKLEYPKDEVQEEPPKKKTKK